MKKTAVMMLAAAAAALAGCKEDKPQEVVQTVEWFKAHDTERKEMIAKCKNNPGELAASPNCINAQQAQNEKDLSRRGYLKLSPVDLNKKGE